jgi:predicted TPR repeat methyltransferase
MLRYLKDEFYNQYDRFIGQPFRLQHIHLLRDEIIGNCHSVLDIGCGDGSHMASITPFINYAVGIDAFAHSLDKAQQAKIYSQTYLMDVKQIDELFENDSFDCVLAFDLIEHLEKDDGLHLLDLMEKIAAKKVIVFTPNGFLKQGAIQGNEHQIHRSGWTAFEMHCRGFHVIGVHGLKPLLGEESHPRWRPAMFWKFISVLTQPLCTHFPAVAFQIFCTKSIK